MVIHSNRTGAITSHLLYSLACFALVIKKNNNKTCKITIEVSDIFFFFRRSQTPMSACEMNVI